MDEKEYLIAKKLYNLISLQPETGLPTERQKEPNAEQVAAYLLSPQEIQEIIEDNDKLIKLLVEKDLEIQSLRALLNKTTPA